MQTLPSHCRRNRVPDKETVGADCDTMPQPHRGPNRVAPKSVSSVEKSERRLWLELFEKTYKMA